MDVSGENRRQAPCSLLMREARAMNGAAAHRRCRGPGRCAGLQGAHIAVVNG